MSDCTQGGRSVYHAPTHTPAEDELRVIAHFKDGLPPKEFVANRDTLDGLRVLDYLESDGERFERVRECEVESSLIWDSYHGRDFYEHELSCGHTVTSDYEKPPFYCEVCGAKVKVVDK